MKATNLDILNELDKINFTQKEGNTNALDGFESLQSSIIEAAKKQSEEVSKEMRQQGERTSQELKDVKDEIKDQGYAIGDSIDNMSYELGYKLDDINNSLFNIHVDLSYTNQILGNIHDSLAEMVKLISLPNEVEALELADQTRVNLALNRRKEALEIASKARSLCGTSIPVTAYYILALTAQEEDNLDTIKNHIEDYAKLITFMLKEKAESESLKSLISIIISMTYPVIIAVGRKFGAAILPQIKEVYSAIATIHESNVNFFESGIYKEAFEEIFRTNSIFRELHLSLCYDVLVKNHHSDRKEAIRDIRCYMWRINASQSPISSELTKSTTNIIYKDKLYNEMYDYYYKDSKTVPSVIAINNWIENEFLNNAGSLSLPIQSITVKYINKNDDLPKKNYSKFISSYMDKLNQKKEEFNNKLKEPITNHKNKANDTINEIRDNISRESPTALRKLDSSLNSFDNTFANRTAEIEIIKQKIRKNNGKKGRFNFQIFTYGIPILVFIISFIGIVTNTKWFNWEGWNIILSIIFGIPITLIIAGVIGGIIYAITVNTLGNINYSEEKNEEYTKEIENKKKSFENDIDKERIEVYNVINEIRVMINSVSRKAVEFREYYINEQNRLKERQRSYSQLFLGDYDEYFTEIDGEEFVLELPSADELLKGFDEPIESVNSKIDSMIKRSKYEEKSN